MTQPASLRGPTCPDELAIDRFVAGTMDDRGRQAMLGHLAGCQACCHVVGALMTGSVSSPPSHGEHGPRLAHYRVGDPVGFGGMGMVYSAYDPRLDRKVALKVLWTDGDAERLHHEARAMAKLAHPNVVPVFDVGVDRGRVYVVMELADGGTVRTWLGSARRAWPEVLAVFRQAGAGIAAAHAAGLVHRDIKPENLLLRRDGTVLVSDFGLARAAPPALFSQAGVPLDAGVSTVAGTPAYMAPEQLRGEPIDTRADVYAFSVALWEGLFGQRPFPPGSAPELLASISRGPVVPAPLPGVPAVPPPVARAVARGLAYHRHDRFGSVAELSAAIDAALSSPPPPQGPYPNGGGAAHQGANGHVPPAASAHASLPFAATAPSGYLAPGPAAPPIAYLSVGPATPPPPPNAFASAAPSSPQAHGANAAGGPFAREPAHGHGAGAAYPGGAAGTYPPPLATPTAGTSSRLWIVAAVSGVLVVVGAGVAFVAHRELSEPTPSEPTARPALAANEPSPSKPRATASTLEPAPEPTPTAPKGATPAVAPAPTNPKPAPAAVVDAGVAPPAPSAKADAGTTPVAVPKRKVRGFDFDPYGLEAEGAVAVFRARQADFDACVPEGQECVEAVCDFVVGASGTVSSTSCRTWRAPTGCSATVSCLGQKLRAIRFPAPPKVGTCQVSFAR